MEDIVAAMDQRYQVDVILLDFSKAFDMVQHQRSLHNILKWLNIWLTHDQKFQRVVVDGQQSEFVLVQYGVPQGTVLEPLMFLVCINDISGSISLNIQFFADDCILYHVIKDRLDQDTLQADLNVWTKIWQMAYNVNKCVVLRMQ